MTDIRTFRNELARAIDRDGSTWPRDLFIATTGAGIALNIMSSAGWQHSPSARRFCAHAIESAADKWNEYINRSCG